MSKQEYIIRRKKTTNFTIFDNNDLHSDILSLRATGLLTRLLSLPADYRISIKRLADEWIDGRTAITSAMTELIEAGYAYLTKARDIETGELKGSRWFISDDRDFILEIAAFSAANGYFPITAEEQVSLGSENPVPGKPNPIISNEITSNVLSKSHSSKSEKPLKVRDGQIEKDGRAIWSEDSWQWKGANWTWDKLLALNVIAKSMLRKKEQTLQKWADVLDKIVRLDGYTKEDINLTLQWLFTTAEDIDDAGQPSNGGFWLIKAKFSTLSTLRTLTRSGAKTKFEAMLNAQREWSKNQ